MDVLKQSVRTTWDGSTFHLPTEMNYNAMSSYLQDNPSATLGDMVGPYLQGQFLLPQSDVETNPPSYQSNFPLSEEQTNQIVSAFGSPQDGYSMVNLHTKPPEFDMVNNATRVLSGRLRDNPAFVFKPAGMSYRAVDEANRMTRTSKKHRNLKRQGQKILNLLNTNVSPVMAEMDAIALASAPRENVMRVHGRRTVPILAGEPMDSFDMAFRLLKSKSYISDRPKRLAQAKVQRLARKTKNRKTKHRYARNLARGTIRPGMRRQTGLVRVTRNR